MPWSVGDVEKHRKGLTPEQKKKWVGIANGVYSQCIKDGGNDKTCAPKAIRIANSKFYDEGGDAVTMVQKKVPNQALNLVEPGCFAKVAAPEKEGGKHRLDMTCYSGKIIKGHWFWGDLAIDLDGMSFPKDKYPILDSHDPDRKVAFIEGKPVISESKSLVLDPDTVTFVDTPYADEFIKLSKEGFPYEASIRGLPTKLQFLESDQEADVNGYTMKGPGTIWRKTNFKEVSVCVFGADDRTKSKAFGEDGDEVDLSVEIQGLPQGVTDEREGDNKEMTLEDLKKEHPDLITELTAEIESKFSEEKATLENQFTSQLKETNTKLATLEEANRSMEKQLSIRAEKDRQEEAAKIFDTKLSESKVPETLYEKVRRQIDYLKFVKDDSLDVVAFSTAVDEEIKDWETRIGDKILGFGTSKKQETESMSADDQEKEDEAWLKKMTSLAS